MNTSGWGFEIAAQMTRFVRDGELGVVLVAPRDVLIRREPLRVRQPDILYLSAARAGVRRPSDLVGQSRLGNAAGSGGGSAFAQ